MVADLGTLDVPAYLDYMAGKVAPTMAPRGPRKSTSAIIQATEVPCSYRFCAERKLMLPVGRVQCDRDGLDENVVVSDRRDQVVLDRRAAFL